MSFTDILVVSGTESLKGEIQTAATSLGRTPNLVFDKSPQTAFASAMTLHAPIVIIDWDGLDAGAITAFLQKMRRSKWGKTAPTLFVSTTPGRSALAVAMEYDVRQMLLKQGLKEHLRHVFRELAIEISKPSAFNLAIKQLEESAEHHNREEWEKAVTKLYEDFPTHPRAQLENANLLFVKGQLQKAEAEARKLVSDSTDNVRAINLLARTLFFQGKNDEAMTLLSHCEMLSPQNVDRLVTLGNLFWQKGDAPSAQEKFQQAARIDENNKDAQGGLAILAAGRGEVAEAIEFLRKASSEYEAASFFNNAGVVAARCGRANEANKLYDTALTALAEHPIRSRILFNIGMLHLRSGEKTKAQSAFEKALEVDPQYAKAKHFAGNVDAEKIAGDHEELMPADAGNLNKDKDSSTT